MADTRSKTLHTISQDWWAADQRHSGCIPINPLDQWKDTVPLTVTIQAERSLTMACSSQMSHVDDEL